MVHVPLTFLSNGVNFLRRLALQEKNDIMTALVSMLLKSRASPDILPFSLCNKKRLAIRHKNRPIFPSTLSILFCQVVVRAKDLTARPPTTTYVQTR